MPLADLLFYGFCITCLVQLGYYLLIFLPFGFYRPTTPRLKKIGISVLVCAKNEAENLKNLVPAILDQDYPDFELVLINDGSTDDTLEVMQEFEQNNGNIRIVDVKPIDSFWNNKKYPLTLGIKAAKNEFLLFTDADCLPKDKDWIKSMSRHFSNEKRIVLGYGSYKKIKGSLLNLLIRFETVHTALQYFSFALKGRPYMGVGRNLAYRRDLFFEASGFKDHMHILSGDDDLFINQVANGKNTAICIFPSAFTESVPKRSLTEWINQKRRHFSAAPYYKMSDKLMLGSFNLSLLLFWVFAINLAIIWEDQLVFLIVFSARVVVAMTTYGLAAKKFKAIDTIWLYPFLELFLVLFHLAIFMINLFSKRKHWK